MSTANLTWIVNFHLARCPSTPKGLQTAHESSLGPLSSQALGAASEAGQKSAFETRQRQDERGSHSREERQPAIPRVGLVSPVAPRMGSTAIGGGEGMREQL